MKIFISASSKNFLETNFLISKLEERVDKKKDISFWYADNKNVNVGSDLDNIVNNILDSQGAVILVSNNFLNSSFITQKELPEILKKREMDKNYKLVPILLDENVNFENFEEISLQKIKYINSRKTPFKEMSESQANVLCDSIIQELNSYAFNKNANEVRKILRRIELVDVMINTLIESYNSKRYKLAQGLMITYSNYTNLVHVQKGWSESLHRFQVIIKETLEEIDSLDNKNKKMKTLEPDDYEKLEALSEKIHEFELNIKKSIDKHCSIVSYDTLEHAEEAIVKLDSESPRSAYKCMLCNSYKIGFDFIPSPYDREEEYDPVEGLIDDF